MSGLTPEGLVIQRLSDVLEAQRLKAVELFQDLVPPGEVVDTSENSALGRLTALVAPSIADLWEAIQQVDSAFDPEKATGIALDEIVKYGGIQRLGSQKATLQAIFTGNNSVIIPFNSAVRGIGTNAIWRTRAPVTFDVTAAAGVIIDITTITNSAAYSITYTTSAGSNTLTYTSDASATRAEILAGLTAALSSPHLGIITSTADGSGYVNIDKTDPYNTSNFTTTSNLTIIKVKTAGEMIAEEAGVISQPINTVTSIATPVLNWDSVYNYQAASGGTNGETDEELRLRFRNTKYERASNILEALYSALISVDGVDEVVIYENDTDVLDGNGVPAHSFMPVVTGTADLPTLAQVVWQNKPIGIKSFSLTTPSTPIFDSQGFQHLIGIQIPDPVTIYISVNLTTNSSYPADGNDQVKQSLIDYFKANFGIGDDVIYSRLYTPINEVPGHQVESLTIGTSPSPVGTANIAIDAIEISNLLAANIIIT
jgi:uncharacterized phage protein gp47/JayE